jgi:hypothetical protein
MPIINQENGLGEYEEITRAYVDFLWGTGAGGSVEEGLVLLWAMEKVGILSIYQGGKLIQRLISKLGLSPSRILPPFLIRQRLRKHWRSLSIIGHVTNL